MAQCHISWDSFNRNICRGLSHLQQEEEFVDMTLAADGYIVKVHKNILALASPYIKDMLKSLPCQNPVLFLNSVSHKTLSYLLEYVYRGQVEVPSVSMNAFIDAAKALHIVGIDNTTFSKKVAKDLLENRNLGNNGTVPSVSKKVNKSNDTTLKGKATKERVSPQDKVEEVIDLEIQQPKTTIPCTDNSTSDLEGPTTKGNFFIDTIQLANDESDFDDMNGDVEMRNQPFNIPIETNIDTTMLQAETDFTNDFSDLMSIPQSKQNNENKYKIDIKLPEIDSSLSNNRIETGNFSIQVLDDNTAQFDTNEADTSETNNKIGAENSSQVLDINSAQFNTNQQIKNDGTSYNIDIKIPTSSQSSVPMITINAGQISNLPQTAVTQEVGHISHDFKQLNAPLFTFTGRSSLQMILNRFMYNIHHKSKGSKRRRWRCVDYRHKRCPAYVDTNEELIISRKFVHKHPFHDAKIIKTGRRKKIFNTISEAESEIRKQDFITFEEDVEDVDPDPITDVVLI